MRVEFIAAVSVFVIAYDQIAFNKKHFLPVVVDEWFFGEHSGCDSQ